MLRLLLLSLVYFPAAHLLGQALPIGIKTGANATIVSSGYPVYEKRLKPGFHVGAFTSLRLNKFITFQPELVFSFQGTKAEYGSFSIIPYASGITSIHLSYLTLPLVLKLNVYRGFNAQFALQPGVLIAARERGEVNVDPRVQPPGGPRTLRENVKANYRTLDAVLCAGLGYDSKFRWSADVRVMAGVVSVRKPGSPLDVQQQFMMQYSAGPAGAMRNYGLQLSLRYAFRQE